MGCHPSGGGRDLRGGVRVKQSRIMSLIESVTSIAVGFGISLACQIVFLPMLGVTISLTQNVTFAVIMTVVSICRQYIMRRIFEALHIRNPLSPGALAIVAERRRQIEAEGWTPDHDLAHKPGELAKAGACYAMARGTHVLHGEMIHAPQPAAWPWESSWWKPADQRRNLVKAGALILAELDRSDHERKRKGA